MQCKSASSTLTDGYRAGCELGESLKEIAPEVILLFVSITYHAEFGDLLAGLEDSLDSPGVLIFGGTSDGVYECHRVSHCGVSALGLNSGGMMQWSATVVSGVGADSYGAARQCALDGLARAGGRCSFAFTLADGLKADGTRIVSGLASVLDIPFFGGLTSDDRKFSRSFVLSEGKMVEDSVALLLGRGSLACSIHAASGWTPIGAAGQVDECDGSVIRRIGGMPAQGFIREQLGKAPSETDLGILPLATYASPGDEHFYLRSTSRFDPDGESFKVFGSIDPGVTVRVCTATRDDIISAVQQAIDGVRQASFEPTAAIIVSCAARKWLLENSCTEEVERVFQGMHGKIPLVGLPSFGEIGPFRRPDGSYTSPFFHNVTYVICLIGT